MGRIGLCSSVFTVEGRDSHYGRPGRCIGRQGVEWLDSPGRGGIDPSFFEFDCSCRSWTLTTLFFNADVGVYVSALYGAGYAVACSLSCLLPVRLYAAGTPSPVGREGPTTLGGGDR